MSLSTNGADSQEVSTCTVCWVVRRGYEEKRGGTRENEGRFRSRDRVSCVDVGGGCRPGMFKKQGGHVTKEEVGGEAGGEPGHVGSCSQWKDLGFCSE